MDLSPVGLLIRVRDTLADPREGARRIIALGVAAGPAWDAIVLTAILSTILMQATLAVLPPGSAAMFGPSMASPVRVVVMQGVITALAVFAMHRVGRARGGHGTLPQAVALMAWLQFILLVMQGLQLLVLVLVPPLALFVELAGLGAFFWVLTHFVAELHGFRSLGATFAGIVGVMVGGIFALALLIAPFAGSMPGGE